MPMVLRALLKERYAIEALTKVVIFDHLIEMIMESLLINGRLLCKEVALQIVCFGFDGVFTF